MLPDNPDRLVELTSAPSEAAAGILQSVLVEAGIESWTQKAPGLDYFGLGTLGFAVTSVMVRESDLEDARIALDANRQDSVDIDWSEVDVGEPEDAEAERIAAAPEHADPGSRSKRSPLSRALAAMLPSAVVNLFRRSD